MINDKEYIQSLATLLNQNDELYKCNSSKRRLLESAVA